MARKKTGRRAETKSTTDSKRPSRWLGLAAIAAGVIVLAYLIYGVVLYLSDLTDGFTGFWTSLFFYPAAGVMTKGYLGWMVLSFLVPLVVLAALAKLVWDGAREKVPVRRDLIILGVVLLLAAVAQYWIPPISNTTSGYGEYIDRVNALGKLQAKQQQQVQAPKTDPATVHAGALQQLVQGDVIRQVAVKLNVRVSGKEVNDFYKQMADQNQGEANLKKQIKDLLGWSPEQFKQEIKLRLLQEKIAQKLSTDKGLNKSRQQQADAYLKQVKGGADFGAVAKQAGSGMPIVGQPAGDQPTSIKKGESDPAIEGFAFKANVGDVSSVLRTQSAFVIVKVVEKTSADEVKVQQIVVPTLGANEYFMQQLKDTSVSIYIHGLTWNKTLYTVEPKGGVKPVPQQPAKTGGTPAPAASTPATPAP